MAAPVLSSETEDVERARGGDLGAFERLYRANVGRVYAVCLRLTGNRAEAEERTQDAFVKAWEHLGAFRGESRFSTWLHSLAVSTVLMEARSGGRRERHLVPVADVERLPLSANPADPGASLDLERALRTLPGGARETLVLHDVYGYKHEEIARLTGTTPGTSKSQLHRARKLLREALP